MHTMASSHPQSQPEDVPSLASLMLMLHFTEHELYERSECVRIIKGISDHFHLSCETRDLSILLADSFVRRANKEDRKAVKLIAATSTVVASKLFDCHHLKMVSFIQIPYRILATFECLLTKVLFNGSIDLRTPSIIAKQLLFECNDRGNIDSMRSISVAFIGYFLEIENSLTFSLPSVALAGVVIADIAMRQQRLEGTSSILNSSLLDKYSISIRETAACLECFERHRAECHRSLKNPHSENKSRESIEPATSSLGKRPASHDDSDVSGGSHPTSWNRSAASSK